MPILYAFPLCLIAFVLTVASVPLPVAQGGPETQHHRFVRLLFMLFLVSVRLSRHQHFPGRPSLLMLGRPVPIPYASQHCLGWSLCG